MNLGNVSEIKIEFNSAGFREVLLSEGVKTLVTETAYDIAKRADANLTNPYSDGYSAQVVYSPLVSKYGHGGRWVGFVSASDRGARVDEADNKSLSRAVTG